MGRLAQRRRILRLGAVPPYAEYDAVTGVYLFHGRRVEVGFDFGLAWGHFNFCFVRDMGHPFHGRPFREEEVRRIYHETVFVHGGIHPDRVVDVHSPRSNMSEWKKSAVTT